MLKVSNYMKALASALAALVITTAYEACKSVFLPHLTIRQSYLITILYCTLMMLVITLVALHVWDRETVKIGREKVNFEALLEHMPGLTCVVNRDKKFVRWNSRFQSVLGYTAKELSRMTAPETLWPDCRQIVPLSMGEAWRSGHAAVEAAWVARDGRRIPCYLTGVRVLVSNQPCILSIGIDISQQKRTEEALRLSEEQYHRLLNNLPDVTWTVDVEGRVHYISSNVEELLGYTREDVLAGGLEQRLSRIHPDDMESAGASFRALFHEDRIFNVEYRVLHKDGRWIWVRNRALRTYQQRGVLFADGILTDITEHKKAERVDSMLAAIVRSSNNAILGKTADGTITSWNPAAERMLGYSAAEAIGQHISLIIPPERLDEVPRVLGSLVRGERIERLESVCLRKDGKRIDVALAVSPIMGKSGAILGISTIVSDISLQKQAQRELLRAKEAAESMARAKTEFLANISQELRTPMNGILGMAELALDSQLNTDQREYLLSIQSSGTALLRLISELLDFTRTETGKLALDPVDFHLPETVQQTVRPFLYQARQVGLEIVCDIDPSLPELVRGDPQRLRQVLINLVGNAIKFTHQGRIAVSVACRSRTEETLELLFQISDTGIGIPSDKQATVFEPFTQGNGSSTRRHGGTGLGLAISSRLVKLMGGKIWLESTPGRGSTFYFTVRLEIAASAVLTTALASFDHSHI